MSVTSGDDPLSGVCTVTKGRTFDIETDRGGESYGEGKGVFRL